MSVRLEPVTQADIIPLKDVRVSDGQEFYVRDNTITIAQVRFTPGAYDFCIWDGDTRVGLLALVDHTETDDLSEIDHPQAVYVWRLLVGMFFQGKGYGKAAMAFAEDWARQRGRPLVQVQAVESNETAITVYQSLGYSLTGKRLGEEVQLEKWL